jgi:hypothetical protein
MPALPDHQLRKHVLSAGTYIDTFAEPHHVRMNVQEVAKDGALLIVQNYVGFIRWTQISSVSEPEAQPDTHHRLRSTQPTLPCELHVEEQRQTMN